MLKSIRLAILMIVPALAQAPATFEVASVKPTQHGRNAEGWSRSSVDIPSPGRLVAENSSLDELIRFAYSLKDYQVFGPVWLNDDSESFDITAKAPPDTSKEQMRTMLQTLLTERFGLAAHREHKMQSIYNLTVGKKGFKLKPAISGEKSQTASGGGKMVATNLTMAGFAYQLSRQLKYPVFDQTRIEGAFDFTLRYAPEESNSGAPSLFTAIQETMGLKLESGKGPVETLVIDHIDRTPTEN
jgi:uncharacterized protein (TIGR03435 family)